jgi:hypothetical protein
MTEEIQRTRQGAEQLTGTRPDTREHRVLTRLDLRRDRPTLAIECDQTRGFRVALDQDVRAGTPCLYAIEEPGELDGTCSHVVHTREIKLDSTAGERRFDARSPAR